MIVVILACLLGQTKEALAWGPATHVGLAASILEHLELLPGAVAAVLARRKIAYFYGNIAADVVFAKRWSRIKQFCHHWSTAFSLLDGARNDRAQAFAYGYLSHLAADTVAHGKYVPRQIAVSQWPVNFIHFYWELRADAAQTDADWRMLRRLLRRDHDYHHQVLEDHITDTFLPYELNRLLFDRMNSLAVRQAFRRAMKAWNYRSRYCLPPDLMTGYRGECLDRIRSVLVEGSRSALLREDPNGTSALMHIRVRRREVRQLRRRGSPVEHRLLETSRGLAPSARPAAGFDVPFGDESAVRERADDRVSLHI
jgi:hypothetical protein